MNNPRKLAFHTSLATVFLLAAGCAAGPEKNPSPAVPAVAGTAAATFTSGDLEKLRTQSEFYVRKVRQLLPPKSAEAFECEKRYMAAHSSVNGGIVDLQGLVAAGQNPAQSTEYTAKCAVAREEVNSFINYADAELLKQVAPEATVTERSPVTGEVTQRALPFAFLGVDVLAGLGNWAWTKFTEARKISKTRVEEAKKALITDFEKRRWRSSEEIVGPPPK